jgi:hypothetical protein
MLGYKSLRSLLMATVVMVAIPSAANAQAYASKIWSFDVNGGVAIPTGSLSDIAKTGATFGVGFGYAVSDLVGLRIGGDLDLLSGNEDNLIPIATPFGPSSSDIDGAPNITLFHLNGGIDFDFINKPDSKFKFQLYLLGGAVFVNSQKVDFREEGVLGCENKPPGVTNCLIDWQDAYPEFRGGIRLGFELGDCTPARAKVCGEIAIFGGGNVMFGNEDDTEPITELYNASPFGTFIDIPVGINIRINVL